MAQKVARAEMGFTLFEGLIILLIVAFTVASALLIAVHMNNAQKAATKTVQNITH